MYVCFLKKKIFINLLLWFLHVGLYNAESLPLLRHIAKERLIDAVLHVGDYAYDLHNDDGARGDVWFEQMQEIAGQYSYMALPGNHEAGIFFYIFVSNNHQSIARLLTLVVCYYSAHNFTHYRNRFSMPNGESDGLYWSLDVSNVHLVGIDTELYFYDTRERQAQMERWLRADLAKANANRKNVPWIIVMGHRPVNFVFFKKMFDCLCGFCLFVFFQIDSINNH